MKSAVVRLVLAATLFVGWLGFLAYLVLTARNPVVLSRPQLLVADVVVIARVEGADKPVVVEEVVWPGAEARLKGEKLLVMNLEKSKRTPHKDESEDKVPPDFTGPGSYILALRERSDGETFEVVPIPASPGRNLTGPPRIYPLTGETRAQLEQIKVAMAAVKE